MSGTAEEPLYPFRPKWQPEFVILFKKHNIYLSPPFMIGGVYKPGDQLNFGAKVIVEPFATMPNHRFYSSGSFSYSNSAFPAMTKVGRFCSLSAGIRIMGHAHPIRRFTTSPVTYGASFAGLIKKQFDTAYEHEPFNGDPLPITIGNDVWIGGDVILKSGITIGDGAVIGGGAVVSKDVAPYSIMVGSPATVKRMRFDERLVERLLATKWWNYNFAQLPNHLDDIDRFVSELETAIAADRIEPYLPLRIDVGGEIFRMARELNAARRAP